MLYFCDTYINYPIPIFLIIRVELTPEKLWSKGTKILRTKLSIEIKFVQPYWATLNKHTKEKKIYFCDINKLFIFLKLQITLSLFFSFFSPFFFLLLLLFPFSIAVELYICFFLSELLIRNSTGRKLVCFERVLLRCSLVLYQKRASSIFSVMSVVHNMFYYIR